MYCKLWKQTCKKIDASSPLQSKQAVLNLRSAMAKCNVQWNCLIIKRCKPASTHLAKHCSAAPNRFWIKKSFGKQQCFHQMIQNWHNAQGFTGLATKFLVLLVFLNMFGSEQSLQLLWRVLWAYPQFQVIMNHGPTSASRKIEQIIYMATWMIPADTRQCVQSWQYCFAGCNMCDHRNCLSNNRQHFA